MKNDLSEAFQRLEWCRGEISTIEKTEQQHSESKPYTIRRVPLHATMGARQQHVVDAIKEFPFDIKARSGATANELRSILDSLASTLAGRNGHASSKGTYFPIAKSEHNFDNDPHIKRKISKLSSADKLRIRSLEPWIGGNDLLAALHASDITKKHHRLITIAQISSGFGLINGSGKNLCIRGGTNFKNGESLFTSDSGSSFDISLDLILCFSEPPFLSGKSVVRVLNDFAGLVEQSLELFN